ncbi:unnamed protein product (macronuclear) [Paramecium tetraurelia]|uniref:C2 domain-containing protein n=1 Tax=Paramecium tetraurelia TaxID=5888 RepID=A0DZV1_PARTE|nr:uncharacterized protein GSPATT00021736001 [Paramecium tetraurelia]CAK88568.1 unnamed protein product [Paramecium tetraurelia]|eukprot:XP_001455965.1 hypothetical protein (macronuclear) [Paramecium tetraurelia strain d4-2]
MDQQRSSLCVSLHNVEFAKDYHYFITVQLNVDGEKKRTDVSAQVAAPVFAASTFIIPLSNFKLDINDYLHFEAYVVTDREQGRGPELDNQGQARLLGECILKLGDFTGPLTDISGTGVRQHLKFVRRNDKQVTVGRFIVNLKLVGEQIIPINDEKPLESDEIFQPLPASDPFMSFTWRLRVDIRACMDMPLHRDSQSGLPRGFVKLGWSQYDNQPPSEHHMHLTKIRDQNRHPIWNQQFLIPNPQTVTTLDGYLYLSLVDDIGQREIESVYFPISQMRPFQPMNFELQFKYAEYEARPRLYMSITLEMADKQKFLDELIDIIVKMVHYDPLPYASRTNLIMTLNQTKIKEVPYSVIDLKGAPTLAQALSNAQSDVFISSIMKIPPHKADKVYNAVAVFTLPKSQFGSILYVDLNRVELHSIQPLEMTLSNLCIQCQMEQSDIQKQLMIGSESYIIPRRRSKHFSRSLGLMNPNKGQLTCMEAGDNPAISRVSSSKKSTRLVPRTPDMKALAENVSGADRSKWDILSKELSQKQEMIHRLMKEVDDKTESLKITGTEIVDLRRQVKLLQSENSILRKRLAHEESLEIQSIITKEIAVMSMEELRQKIIKVAQAYRNERVRNEEFEKALKTAQKDIASARQLEVELESLQRVHQENAKKMLVMQQEIQKVGVYKEAVKKQETVISKLEKLMETSLKDAQKARQAQLEVEQLKSENLNLQKQLKGIVYGEDIGELERYKQECQRLEKIVANMKEELRNKRPVSNSGADWEQDKMELEVKLHKANARIEALQDEMTYNAKNYAKEIAQLKLIIAEKQALLDSLTMGGQ